MQVLLMANTLGLSIPGTLRISGCNSTSLGSLGQALHIVPHAFQGVWDLLDYPHMSNGTDVVRCNRVYLQNVSVS